MLGQYSELSELIWHHINLRAILVMFDKWEKACHDGVCGLTSWSVNFQAWHLICNGCINYLCVCSWDKIPDLDTWYQIMQVGVMSNWFLYAFPRSPIHIHMLCRRFLGRLSLLHTHHIPSSNIWFPNSSNTSSHIAILCFFESVLTWKLDPIATHFCFAEHWSFCLVGQVYSHLFRQLCHHDDWLMKGSHTEPQVTLTEITPNLKILWSKNFREAHKRAWTIWCFSSFLNLLSRFAQTQRMRRRRSEQW